MKFQKLTIQNVEVLLRKIESNPGLNKVRSTILNQDAVFSVTETEVRLIEGEVIPSILPVLQNHVAIYFRPRGRTDNR